MISTLAVLLAVLALGIAASAQTRVPQSPAGNQAHKLEIVVADENGVAVQAAIILLTAPQQPIPIRCQTDFAGHCVFSGLQTGTYKIQVEKQGFYAAVSNLEAGTTTSIDVTLSHQQEVREIVNVSESPPVIDPAQVSSKEELTGLDVIDIPYPGTHDYRNVLNFIPGVVKDAFGQPHVSGAETYQTMTLVDGFNVTQPANGLLLVRVSSDAFRSIDVEPSREPAEYGKASAGVLALNTGIGDDHFHFVSTDFLPSFQNKKGWHFDQWVPRFTVSGPIQQGKTWFFDGLDGEYDNLIIPQLVGADTDHIWRVDNLAKLQTNLTSRNILSASFVFNHLNDQHSGLSPLSPVPTTPQDVESAYIGTIKDQYYFSGGELLEAGFNVDQYNLSLTPAGDQPYFIALDSTGGNYYLNMRTQARRYQALSNLNLRPHYWHGRHDIKAGVDLDRIVYDAEFLRRPVSFWSTTTAGGLCPTDPALALSEGCTHYSTFSGGSFSTIYNSEASAYMQDQWSASSRLLIEPGVRFDWDQIVRKPLASPRLAGTYVLDNSGNTKLSAGVGIVYDATNLVLIARPYAGQRTDTFFFRDARGTPATSQVVSTFSVNRGALQAPGFVNWSVALEKRLPASIFMKAEFLQRQGERDFVYDTANGLTSGNFVLQNTRQDRYNAFQFSLRHSFRQRYAVMGSYTRSSARSNQVLDFNVDNPILSPQLPGPFLWDVPNRFLSWGYVPFFSLPVVHALDLAYSLETRTGFPFNVSNDRQQLVEPPGSRRFPTYFTLNLQLEKRFHLFGYYWALRGGFNNITNRSNPVVVNADINSPQFLTFSGSDRRAFTSRIRFLGRK